jgi:hypothetical protein
MTSHGFLIFEQKQMTGVEFHGTSNNICLIHAATMLQLSPNKKITLQCPGDYWSILEYMMLA